MYAVHHNARRIGEFSDNPFMHIPCTDNQQGYPQMVYFYFPAGVTQ